MKAFRYQFCLLHNSHVSFCRHKMLHNESILTSWHWVRHSKRDLAGLAELSVVWPHCLWSVPLPSCSPGLRFFLDNYKAHHKFPRPHKFRGLSTLQLGQFLSSLYLDSATFTWWQELSLLKFFQSLATHPYVCDLLKPLLRWHFVFRYSS